jgi:hypothetical protein
MAIIGEPQPAVVIELDGRHWAATRRIRRLPRTWPGKLRPRTRTAASLILVRLASGTMRS